MTDLNHALAAFNAGRLDEARKSLSSLLKRSPDHLDSLYLLAVTEQAAQRHEESLALYRKVLAQNRHHPGVPYNMALLLSGLGRHTEALPQHDAAVRLAPGNFWTYVNRGNSRAALLQFEAAIADYDQALKIRSDCPEALTNKGNALREMGRFEEAMDAHNQALALRAHYADALSNRGVVLLKLKQPEQALTDLELATQLEPGNAKAWLNRGTALNAYHNRHVEALACYDRAIELQPEYAEAYLQRGVALSSLKHHDAALENYRKALELDAPSAKVWRMMGMAFMELKQWKDSLAAYRQARELDSNLDFHLNYLLRVQATLCDWSDWERDLPALAEQIREDRGAAQPLDVMALLDSPQLQLQAASHLTELEYPERNTDTPLPRAETGAGQRIRIAYFSADFRDHPVSQQLVELLEHHDRSRFEIFGFSLGPGSSSLLGQRIAKAFDRFMDVHLRSDREIAYLARELKLDIAVNLSGYTADHRTGVFALRAAPVQVNYLGFPGTMGAGYMNYLITDTVVCPPGSERYYAEKLARLPHCFMPHDSTQAISDRTPTRSEFDLPETGFVFCCFNSFYKIAPQVFDIWMRLLQQVEGSVLWLSDGPAPAKENLRMEAGLRGIDPGRIRFAPRVEQMPDHLARYRLADLFVDTLPYNAHATACDALWAGVPVLTCTGESFASRVAASLLKAIGLPELITSTHTEYEARALELATKPQKLTSLRQKLAANRLTTALFDTRRLAGDIEQIYCAMYERYLNGLPPDHLHS